MTEKYFIKELTRMMNENIILFVHESKPVEYLIMKKGTSFDVFEQKIPMIVYKKLLDNASYTDVVDFFKCS
ncbi:MAG: hypothetical protein KKH92_00370 [Firmicutes bacterium]|nr:hypothetical protein [Bacillota bacterium]